jgi:hypothetical protein
MSFQREDDAMSEAVTRRTAVKAAVAGVAGAAVFAVSAKSESPKDSALSWSEKSFEAVGLPRGHAFPTVAYHQATRTIFAHTEPLRPALPTKRLSFRRVADKQYQPIGEFPADISVESFVLSPSQPFLYYSTNRWKHEGDGASGDWEGLYRFDIGAHRSEQLAQRGKLHPPSGYQGAWLSGLLSINDDGKALFCKAALETGKLDPEVEYWIAKLELPSLKLQAISQLQAIFA